MHASVYDFVTRVLGRDEVEGKRVLEVGALDVNGSVRPYVTSLRPAEYVGTDRRRGRRVDVVVNATRLIDRFGCDRFDVVLCLETLEHIQQWRIALWCMLAVLRTGGTFVLTTRSPGFPRHEHPDDWWRWDPGEFSDFLFTWGDGVLIPDPEAPGLLLSIVKHRALRFDELDRIHATPAPYAAP
jgi:SAM-dependent methyltransferase